VTSTRWYKIAVLLVVLGLVAGVAWWARALLQVTDTVEGFRRIGRGATVAVDEPGPHTVWAERPCAGYCPLEAADTYRRHIRVAFEAAGGDGHAPRVVPHPSGGRYNVGQGRDGRAVWLVTFPAAGEYRVDVRSDAEVISPELWLGEGEHLPARVLVPAVQLAAVGVAGGLVLTLLTYRARRRSADRLAERLASR
jgi:hypothetical protein